MALPTILLHAIEDGRAEVLAHPTHALRPARRLAIYHALGPLHSPAGKRARVWVGIITARHVAHRWQQLGTDHLMLEHALATAELVVRQMRGTHALRRHIRTLEKRLRAVAAQGNGLAHDAAFFAGLATLAALDTVMDDSPFKGLVVTDEMIDAELGPYHSDAAACAVAAYAGGLYDEEANPSLRHAFWGWWLAKAVVPAWERSQ